MWDIHLSELNILLGCTLNVLKITFLENILFYTVPFDICINRNLKAYMYVIMYMYVLRYL